MYIYIYIYIYIHIFQGFPQVLRTWGAANLLKMNVFTHIVLFLGIMLWKGASHFNGEVSFSDGGVSFLIGGGGGTSWRASFLMGGVWKKYHGMSGEAPLALPLLENLYLKTLNGCIKSTRCAPPVSLICFSGAD